MRLQTAVDFLADQISSLLPATIYTNKELYEVYKQAKQMEKNQIESAYCYLHFENGGEFQDNKERAASYYDAFYGEEK